MMVHGLDEPRLQIIKLATIVDIFLEHDAKRAQKLYSSASGSFLWEPSEQVAM